MDIRIKIGNRVKTLAENAGLSARFLAWDSELDESYINDIKRGTRNVSIQTLEKICTALHISITEFFNDESFDEQSKLL